MADTPNCDEQTLEYRRALHEQECAARIRWCLQQGMTPASEHVHRAPGNDANFMFGVPPWMPDGAVNPAGVPYGRPEDCVVDKSRQLPDYASKDSQKKEDKASHAVVPMTCQQKKLAQAAKGCMRLDEAWGFRTEREQR